MITASQATAAPPLRRIEGLSEVLDAYRVLLVDAYGTLHDGRSTLPFVAEAMTRARRAGRVVIVVTNSPQRISGMTRRMRNVGFPDEGYDHIASSGELTWRDLDSRDPGAGVHFIIEGTSFAWLEEVRNPLVPLHEAEIVVAAGMPHATEDEAAASPLAQDLAAARARDLPLLVADSDYHYPEHGRIRLGPGWIARHYAGLGGPVTEYGKPFDPIYDEALRLAGDPDPGEVLMIGDNLATDVLGAARRGFASLLVLEGGVHGGLDETALAEEAARTGATPTYVARHLRW